MPELVNGHRIGKQLMHADEAAVLHGPQVFALSDLNNPEVDIHTARILVDSKVSLRFRTVYRTG